MYLKFFGLHIFFLFPKNAGGKIYHHGVIGGYVHKRLIRFELRTFGRDTDGSVHGIEFVSTKISKQINNYLQQNYFKAVVNVVKGSSMTNNLEKTSTFDGKL